jgi:hypothetical protein
LPLVVSAHVKLPPETHEDVEREAVQFASAPPFAPEQVQFVELPLVGKEGLVGEGSPTEQKVFAP